MDEIREDKIYKLREAAFLLCVSRSTLRVWDRDGYFVAGRTRGEHRIYTGKQLKDMKNKMFRDKRS
jgi:DNA-binding transcriptional MerR regulator